MRIIRGLPAQTHAGRVVTMGVFDGVHRGHERILLRVKALAQRLGQRSAVITFHDHPHSTIAPQQRPPRLVALPQCLARIKELGLDEVYVVRFTRAMSQIPAERFVREYLVRRLQISHIVVGADFAFGRNGSGNHALLRRLGRELGFAVSVVPALRLKAAVVSSSALRRLVAAGKIRMANRQLGRPYALHGVVVHGEGRGTGIGLPTANLLTRHEVVPRPGTYAVEVTLNGQAMPALCHIGHRPTFHAFGPQTIEVHVPGWRGRLYGRHLEVRFRQYLRGEQKFAGAEELIAQVKKDWLRVKRIWTNQNKGTTMKKRESSVRAFGG